MTSSRRWPVLVACALAACAAPSAAPESTATSAQPIVHGTPSTTEQDFVVQLAMLVGGRMYPTCSGTMVAKNLVLTARHCVGRVNDDVTVDDYDAADLHVYKGRDAPSRVARAQRADANGKSLFVPATKQLIPDVALILLDTPLATPIAPLRLDGGAKKDELLDVIGFGIDESSQQPTTRRQRKAIRVLDIGPGRSVYHELFDGEFVFGEAACSGDSGGPAISSTTKAVVGVASRVSNGKDRTEQDPAGFCIGSETEDVYTALEPVKDVVADAFEAAGATPALEAKPAPPPPPKPAPAEEDAAEDEQPEPAPTRVRTTTTTSSGCATSMRPPEVPFGALAVVASLLGAAAMRPRKRRVARP